MTASMGTPADIMAREDSVPVGIVEHRIWKPFGELALALTPGQQLLAVAPRPTKKDGWNFVDAVLKAARQFDHDGKNPGDRMGPLGPSGIKVLETLLFTFADFTTGRIEPALASIAEQAKLARATVSAALKRLKKAGFLSWIRRKREIDAEGPGPRIHQATSAYWIKLRGRAAGLVRLALAKLKPPPPDDAIARRDQDAPDVEAMLDRTSREEVARFVAGDSELGDALAGLGRAIDSSANSITGRNPDP